MIREKLDASEAAFSVGYETVPIRLLIKRLPYPIPLNCREKLAFCRWGVEHAFRLAKSEIGFGHFEGRSWKGLLRHMILCQAVMLS